MGIKISQLPRLVYNGPSTINTGDLLPIVNVTTNGTQRITIGDVKSWIESDFSTLAFSGSYADLQNRPATFPVAIATANQLGGVKIGPNLAITQDGTVDMGPAFSTVNVGNTQILASTLVSSFNLLAGNNIVLTADPATNTITIDSLGGVGGSGSGNVGKGTTGTLAVYYSTNTVTATNIAFDGQSITLQGNLNAANIATSVVTATSIQTTGGDLILAPGGNVSVIGKRITNLSTPVGANDAATKGYVDGQSSRAFGKIAVPGQGLISATSGTDTVNFAAGNNVTITTNPGTKTVTVAVNNTLSFTLLPASTSSIGGVIVGSGLSVDNNGVLSSLATALTTATTSTVGGIKIGSGLSITGDGTLSSAAQFTLNTATSSVLGGVKVGFGLIISADGTISVPTQVLSTATKFILGGVKIGNSISAAVDGTIDVNAANISVATTSTVGVVKPGYGLSVDNTGALNLGVNGNYTITGNLSVAGVISATNIYTTGTQVTIISSGNDLQLKAAGNVITNTTLWVNTTTPATSTSSGALEVTGGVAIGKNFIAGADSIINGVVFGAGGGSSPQYNIAIGSGALGANNGGRFITAIGFLSLPNTNTDQNTAVGYNTGPNLINGTANTLVGISAGTGLVSGTYNSAFGQQTYTGVGASSYNTLIGGNMNQLSTVAENYNTFVGYNIANTTVKPGSYNVAVGGNNLQSTTGTHNTVIGYGAGAALTTANNQVIIGSYDGNAIATLSNYVSLADGSGNLRAQWDNKGQVTFYATATFYSTQNAIDSTSSGAIIVAGGMGVSKDAYIGGNLYVGGSPVITSLTLGTPISSITAGTDTTVISVGANAVQIFSTATLATITSRGSITNNPIHITSRASTTGTSTGALVVDGSIGTAGDVFVGGGVYAGADSTASLTATNIGLFDRGHRVLTNVLFNGDIGIVVTTSSNTASVLAVNIKNTGVIYIEPGNDISILSNGASSVVGTGTVTISATSNLDSTTQRGSKAYVPISVITTNTVSTGTSTGAIVAVGGMGITGNVNILGSLFVNGAQLTTATVFNGGTISGVLFDSNVTNSTSTSIGTSGNGAIATAGGVSIAKDLNIGGNIYINGTTISTSSVFNGGTITGATVINNATSATSTQSGALQITSGGVGVGGRVVASSFYITTASGTAPIGYGPIMGVYMNNGEAIASGLTPIKVNFNAKEYDLPTNTYYDNTSNFRYTPLVGGYYQVNAVVATTSSSATGVAGVDIYKNGTPYKTGSRVGNNAGTVSVGVSGIVPMNGSSDYIEIFFYQSTGASMTIQGSSTSTYFQSAFLRGL